MLMVVYEQLWRVRTVRCGGGETVARGIANKILDGAPQGTRHSDGPSPAATAGGAVPTTVAAGRSWGLIRWLSIGFAGACIVGGIALLAAVADNPGGGSATASRSAVGLAVSPLVVDDSIKMS